MSISIAIIGHNEEYHLVELLPTLSWADEIVYVDAGSSDNSIEVAKKFTNKVFQKENNPNLNVNKSFAIDNASCEWIFYLDPDERIPEDLKTNLMNITKNPTDYVAFSLPRKNFYFNKWLKHGSQYPDIQLRLFKKGFAKFPNKHVHEKLSVNGKIGNIKTPMHHFPYLTISQYLKKFDFYTSFEADFMYQSNTKVNFANSFNYFIYKPVTRFFRRYFLKLGFLDGYYGFFACLFDALNYIVRYFKLIEKYKNEK
ncbi:MAG TPA: glycosyltransferase family 2 protein [Ignavibacteriales bacterium]|nr:glycosyltransferase family 2 protein [Ignavibacteriales bacterium]HOL82163.1 glycosyltransferase family 2 protein [Ignavibacteriales bacterium]HOM65743.1 glycosyltransferase family 2 protein [Ignavibacteriales bacterium]HPD67598.1 glycosyltransferase family 2 protein [Ignavibacteriales bacterium]HPP34291.1 glycosyltransferase family 2 protein [Ignavibacteriales bacterium]